MLPRELLYIADEAFFVGTAVEVTPIRSVDKITIGNGRRGPITEAIQQAFFDVDQRRGRRPARLARVRMTASPRQAVGARSPGGPRVTEPAGQLPPCKSTSCSRLPSPSGASDLHLKVGSYPMMRVNGTLVVASEEKRLDRARHRGDGAGASSAPEHVEKFRKNQDVDLAYSIAGLGRFRCNVFQQRGTVGLVLRVIPTRIKSIDELGLPPVLQADRAGRARPGARHRHDRQRQEHHARRDDRLHQRDPRRRTS